MKTPTLHSTSTPWSEDVTLSYWQRLMENGYADVCVIGAGLSGLNTAYLLAKAGRKVCLLESLNTGQGQSALTTGHITSVLDTRYFRLCETIGLDRAEQVYASHIHAMNKIRKVIEAESIECDLKSVNGYLCASHDERECTILDNETLALQRMQEESISRRAVPPLPAFTTGPCLVFPNQMQFEPLKYMETLAERIVAMGGAIYCHSQVKELRRQGGEIHVMTALGYQITAQDVVVATGTPINNTFAIHAKQTPFRTYAMSYRIPKDSVEPGLYWDLASPYHYVRTHSLSESEDLLILGGEDHKTGQNSHPESCFERLANWANDRFGFLEAIEHRWSGQVLETLDGLPFLGNNPGASKNVYVITGHSGVGVVQSMLGAMIVTDQIMGIQNPWENLYSPSRFSIRDFGGFLKENLHVAAQYSDWLVPQSDEDLKDLDLGEGRLINHGLKKVAVYRNKSGEFEYLNAACPHMGGVVHWNAAESSWDCPCHGSRFDCHGRVIEGPAVSDLKPIYDMEEPKAVVEPEIPMNI